MKKYSWLAIVLLAWSPWFLAAYTTWSNAVFEAAPANSDAISLGDDKIRELKENVRLRAQVETLWGADITGGETGRAREGSARAFYNTACPSVLSDSVTDTAGSGALGTLDDGRLCIDSDDDRVNVWNGSAWEVLFDTITTLDVTGTFTAATAVLTNLSGTTNLIGTPRFASTAGADPYNPLAFTIRTIVTDTTTDAVACAASASLSATALSSQVFGNAGAACYTDLLDLSTRTNATSRALVIANFSAAPDGTACGDDTAADSVRWTIYQDSTATQIGPIHRLNSSGSGNANHLARGGTTFAYLTTLSNAAHEFSLHAEAQDGNCEFPPDATSGSFLTVIDLGPAY